MLRIVGTDEVKLSRAEINRLRKRAAHNGVAINEISTVDQYGEALYCALPKALTNDMLAFFEHHLEGKPYQQDPSALKALE
jgi:hypothetical protein